MATDLRCVSCGRMYQVPTTEGVRGAHCYCGERLEVVGSGPDGSPQTAWPAAAVAQPRPTPRDRFERALQPAVAQEAFGEMGLWASVPEDIDLERPGVRGWWRLREHVMRFLDQLALPVVSVSAPEVRASCAHRPLAERGCEACGGTGSIRCTACGGSGQNDGGACAACLGSGRLPCDCVRTYAFAIPPAAVSGYVSRGLDTTGSAVRYATVMGNDLARRMRPPEWWLTSVLALLAAPVIGGLAWATHDRNSSPALRSARSSCSPRSWRWPGASPAGSLSACGRR